MYFIYRGVQRFAQKAFPNFVGTHAFDLGINVKKFIPPLVEINIETTFTKRPQTGSSSFSIIKQDSFLISQMNLKGVPESERHKEKRRRKKEKREQQREFDGIEEERRQQLEREKAHETAIQIGGNIKK
jgi:hypothetical protein